MALSKGQATVAVVGCGYWGRNLVRNFAELGALAAVADSDSAVAAMFAARYGVPACSFEEVLMDETVAAVAIATPAACHAEHVLQALEAGKHVFVEKPLALTLAEAEPLMEAAARVGRVLMVGHLLQYHPVFLKLRELVASGELGRLRYIYSNRLNLGKVRREENILWSFAPHDISMILTLVGEEPEAVTALGHCYLHKRIADVTTTHLEFPGGESAHVFVSWLHPFKEQKLVVVGEKGMAVFDDRQSWKEKLVLYRHRIDWQDGMPVPNRAEGEAVDVPEQEPLREECLHFLACVSGEALCRTDAAEGIRVLRVLEAAEYSMSTGRRVVLRDMGTKTHAITKGAQIHETAVIDPGAVIGEGTRVWHFSHILPGTRIGRDCVLGQNVMVGPDVTIGDRCKIQNNVSIYKGVTLEDGVFCGPSCVFTNVNNPRAEVDRKDEFRPTRVRKGATIGANATIVCGVTLGAYSFVAAGAVVTQDVPDFALVAGVPARQMGWVSRAGERLGPDLVCLRTGERYREENGKLILVNEELIAQATPD